ncbi:MAG: hypothetical protein K8W52_43445 [Deltaproteobacteria bacterium]|nr:hypothetical protein [Deltaproteobacteria bacterium]
MRRLGIGALALASITCGGGGGNQPVPSRTTVKWLFDSYPAQGIAEGDSCLDLGVDKVRIDIVGPETATLTDSCTLRQVVFQDLVPGTYAAGVTPLDASGASLLKTPVTIQVVVPEGDVTETANIPWEAWATAFTGTFYFRTTWAGRDCAAGTPMVATQLLTLKVGGVPVTKLTESGQHLDGSAAGPCVPSNMDQVAKDVPFGPATMEIVGKDGDGTEQFRKVFDTFVGGGRTNPTMQFDLPGPDAGVDAMPDAAPDAMPDAIYDAMPDA